MTHCLAQLTGCGESSHTNVWTFALHAISIAEMYAQLRQISTLFLYILKKLSSNLLIYHLFVIDRSKIEIDGLTYLDEILASTLKPNACSLYSGGQWTFQKDSAPAHMTKATQVWYGLVMPRFYRFQRMAPSSPISNPLDFCMLGVLEQMVYEKPHRRIDSIKRKLITEWEK